MKILSNIEEFGDGIFCSKFYCIKERSGDGGYIIIKTINALFLGFARLQTRGIRLFNKLPFQK